MTFKDLSPDLIISLNNFIEKNYLVEGFLEKNIYTNIKHLKLLKTYKGMRHQNGLPVNGQRTKTNRKTSQYLNKLR
jgi:small subunit ribosomal protein S13